MPPQSLLIQLATTAADVEFNAHNAECGCLDEKELSILGQNLMPTALVSV
jgi:hypothetical protein